MIDPSSSVRSAWKCSASSSILSATPLNSSTSSVSYWIGAISSASAGSIRSDERGTFGREVADACVASTIGCRVAPYVVGMPDGATICVSWSVGASVDSGTVPGDGKWRARTGDCSSNPIGGGGRYCLSDSLLMPDGWSFRSCLVRLVVTERIGSGSTYAVPLAPPPRSALTRLHAVPQAPPQAWSRPFAAIAYPGLTPPTSSVVTI